MSNIQYSPFAIASNGSRFDESSSLVRIYMEKYPDVSLEAAIGSVVMSYEQELAADTAKAKEEGLIE